MLEDLLNNIKEGDRVPKEIILDPIDDEDYIDYNDFLPWETNEEEENETDEFHFPDNADARERENKSKSYSQNIAKFFRQNLVESLRNWNHLK